MTAPAPTHHAPPSAPGVALFPARAETSPGQGAGVAVQLRGVRRVFGGAVTAVERMDLAVAAGDFVAILGPSGCGKSTLLRLIAGLDQPTQGQVTLGGDAGGGGGAAGELTDPGATRRPAMAYVFQDAHLLPWRTVLGNVTLPLELRGDPQGAGDRRRAAQAALAQVGLADALDRYPAQLSGGMRMRVSLARALVTDPALLLLDEPFAALDEITRQALDEQLRDLWRQRGMTVLFVTHAIHEATYLARRAVVLSRRPARVVEDCSLDLPVERPATLRTTAEFAGEARKLYDALVRGEAWT